MKTLLLSLAALLAAPLALPQSAPQATPPDNRAPAALEILRQVDRTIKAVDAVRYSITVHPTGAATAFGGDAAGEVAAEGWTGGMPARFRTHVKAAPPGATESVELTGGGNGDLYYLIDHKAKKAYVDMDPAVMGRSGGPVRALLMAEFLHDRPYDDELNAETLELLPEQEVSGEPCHQIRVVYAQGQGESIWFFSKNDLLPRRRIQKLSSPEGEGTIERTITNLQPNPTVEPATFDFRLPEGYEQIDDFAP